MTYTIGNKTAEIPAGFTISGKTGDPTTHAGDETSIENGLVIYKIPTDDTANDGDDALTDEEIAAIDWTDSTVTENLRKTYDQFVWVPVETAYVTAEEIDEIITAQSYTDDTSGSPKYTARQKAINYLISQGRYPMAVKITVPDNDDNPNNNEVFYRGILYKFINNNGTVTISSCADFSLDTNKDYYKDSVTYQREPVYLKSTSYADGSSYNNIGITQAMLQEEFNSMIEAVAKNNGFWVGRYETSGMTTRNSDDSTATGVKVVAGTNIGICGMNWYRMYAQQKTFSSKYASLGGMISGSAWDQMMIFVNSTNYNVATTGKVAHNLSNTSQTGNTNYSGNVAYADIGKNIYDLEGNVVELTTEALDPNYRVSRGGYCYNSISPSTRSLYRPSETFTTLGSRSALYVE